MGNLLRGLPEWLSPAWQCCRQRQCQRQLPGGKIFNQHLFSSRLNVVTSPGKHPGLLRKLAGHRWVHHSLPRWGGRRTLCPGALHGASDAVHPSGRGTPPTRQRLRREEFRSVCTTDPGGIFMGSAVGGIMITKGFSLALWPTRVLSRAGVERRGPQSTIAEQMQATIRAPSTITRCRRASRRISINYQPSGSCCNHHMHRPENFYRAIFSQGLERSGRMGTLAKFLH